VRTPPHPDDDLDLPPLDGETEDVEEVHDELDEPVDVGDALDDRTAEDDPLEDLGFDGDESDRSVLDPDEARPVDVGTFELSLSPEEKLLEDDEPDGRPMDDELGLDDETVVADSGEEGPLADDEELREEDLPALDADDDGEVADDALYDRALLSSEEELLWDDRAWAKVDSAASPGDEDDSGMLPVPGDDPAFAARDAAWKSFDEGGRVMAAAFVPGGSVVVALEAPARPLLVRILPDGAARIIAEVESPDGDDASVVTSLRWDASLGQLVAAGTFGVQAFRPT
jgi:hypothetical protein